MTTPEELRNVLYSEDVLKLLNLLPTAVIYLDANERYLFSNEYYEIRYGRKKESTIGYTLIEVLGDDRYKDFLPFVKKALAGEFVQFEMIIPNIESNEPEKCLVTYIPDFGPDGKVRGFAGLAQDITAYKNALDKLNLTIKAAQMGSWSRNIKTGEMIWDNRTQELFGFVPGSFLGTFEAYIAAIHPDDRERCLNVVKKCLEEKTDFKIEYRTLWPDGSIHWLQSMGKVDYDHNDAPKSMHGMVFDITERKQNEEALLYSEKRFESFADLVPQIIWIHEADGRYIYSNKAWNEYSGIPLTEMSQEKSYETIHPEDRELVQSAWLKSQTDLSPYEVEMRIRRVDGVYRWFLAKAFPLKDSLGKVLKWFGVSTDIHKTKVSELKALAVQKLSASLLRANTRDDVIKAIVAEGTKAVGADAMAISWKDPHSKNIDLVGSFGYPEEIKTRYARITMDDDLPAAACAREKKILYFSHASEWTSNQPKPDLTIIYPARTNIPLLYRDEVLGVITFSFREPQDFDLEFRSNLKIIADEFCLAISRIQLFTEQEFYSKKVMELQTITSELSKAKTEPEVKEVIFNRVFSAFKTDGGMMRIPSVDGEALCIEMFKGFSEEFTEDFKVSPLTKKTVANRVYLSGLPCFCETPEDIIENFPDSASLVKNSNTHTLACLPLNVSHGCLGVIILTYNHSRTIPETTRNLMTTLASYCAEALERSRLFDLSEKAVRARDNMISISAHELLTPVAGSKLKLQLLRKKLEKGHDVSREELLKIAIQTDNSLNRLSKLVNDMLDISRINLGKLTLKPEVVNLSQVLTDMMENVEVLTKASSCTFNYSIAPDIRSSVDVYRFEQVITNLISNSCRYASGKPVYLELSRYHDKARLIVQDNGVGIKKEDQKRVFERFERATTLDEKAGLGLGLFIIKQIVDAHDGSIFLESEPEKGAKFVIDLPLYTDFV